MTTRGDVLTAVLEAGKRLGKAALFRDAGLGEASIHTIAGALVDAGELERVDPVAASVIRQAAYALLHEDPDNTIDVNVVETAAVQLPPGGGPG
jgi:hypothetical protein